MPFSRLNSNSTCQRRRYSASTCSAAHTRAGQAEFLRLLREVWREMERHYYAVDVGLVFMAALPREEVEGYLQGRVATLEAILEHIKTHQKEQLAQEETPKAAAAVFDHSRLHFEAELAWTRGLLAKVEQGEIPQGEIP